MERTRTMKKVRKGSGEKIWQIAVLVVALGIVLVTFLAGEGMVSGMAKGSETLSFVDDLTAGMI